MRTEKGQFASGFTGNPNGRPKRADEQFLVDIWDTDGKAVFSDAIRNKETWAIKCLVDKLFPNRKEGTFQVDLQGTLALFEERKHLISRALQDL